MDLTKRHSHHGGAASVEPWFAQLPLSDPRCNNDSCLAYEAAHTASQAQISWLSQFEYGKYTTWFYVAIVGLFAIRYIVQPLTDATSKSGRPGSSSVFDKITALVRSVTYRKLGGRAGEWLGLPSYGVLLLTALAVLGACLLSFVQHPYYRPRRGFGSPPLAIRTGLMATALMPLVVALAGKVNIITLLTGIGHEKLNAFHRYVAWIMFGLSWLHAIPFLYQPAKEDGAAGLKADFYAAGSMLYTGVPPLAMIFFLAMFSFPFVRRMAYELFVYSHIAAAIVFLGLLFWHFANIMDTWRYLWGTMGIWLISLLGRAFKKTSALRIRGPWFRGYPATATKMAGDFTKLQVLVPADWRWSPGQHAFVRFPHLNILDNHPFTIASIPDDPLAHKKHEGEAVNTLTFLVRAHRGFTRRLLDHAAGSPDLQLSAIVDGPYGTKVRPLERRYEDVVLVAGSSGITATLPWLLHLGRCIRTAPQTCVTRRVHLVWMVKQARHVEWFGEELQAAANGLPGGFLDIHVYVTGETQSSVGSIVDQKLQKEARVAERPVRDALSPLEGMEFTAVHFQGRPKLAEVLASKIGDGRTAVLGCGPESLRIDLANAVSAWQRKVLKGEAAEIMLHTETFDW